MEWFGLRFVEGFKDEQGAHPVRRLSCASSRGALWGKIQLGSGGALGHLWHLWHLGASASGHTMCIDLLRAHLGFLS